MTLEDLYKSASHDSHAAGLQAVYDLGRTDERTSLFEEHGNPEGSDDEGATLQAKADADAQAKADADAQAAGSEGAQA